MGKKQYKSAWFCSNCGNESAKWEGRCPACGEWNTMVEEKVPASTATKGPRGTLRLTAGEISRPQKVSEITAEQEQRIPLPSAELNRVLGGGLVPGSMVLVGGEPGIGKSTLVLQNILSIRKRTVLYVSGEESAMQLRMRADRIGRISDACYIVTETSLDNIFTHIENLQPGLVIIDSIQTIADPALESSAGSVSQVRECAARLLGYAKQSNVPVILIGHITKEGSIAGPKVLEHIVDAVLRFEGDTHNMFRILRAIKNRFGSTSEIGIYEMCQRGLREVTNPAEMLLGNSDNELSGSAIGVTMEGARPFLIEAQALVSTAAYGTPQRSVTGFDSKRMNMLLAVLEKRVGFKLAQKDVFLNIAGGMKVNDPAMDLAVICAILSSNVDMVVPRTMCLTGEVGLSGELRPVSRIEQRISEAEKLGMETIIIPKNNLKGIDTSKMKIRIAEVSKVEEAFRTLFS
ncbi:MAG: DNA repair protein RadA [Muribaculaceae bacterium]|nr:DNA repair protein RadA [Muribaculaceae bacterium]